MSFTVQVGQDSFKLPNEGENAGSWGEEVSAWMKAISQALNDLQGVNDIPLTSASLANNQSSPQNIIGLSFDIGTVKSFSSPYFVVRSVDLATVVETGTLQGVYDGTQWEFSVLNVNGDSGLDFTITSGGQVQYYSSNISGTNYSGIIRFRARTIDN